MHKLTLNIFLDELKLPYEPSVCSDKNPTFESISLFNPNLPPIAESLTIGLLTQLVRVAPLYPNRTFLCIRDRFPDAEEGITANMIILKTNLPLAAVFNKALSIFSLYQNWNQQMEVSAAKAEGLQALMDLSESILKNHIDIMDESFKLLSYTKNIEIDDPITNALLQNGYHPEETVEKFRSLRRFEEFETEKDMIISDDHKLCDYVTIKKIFHRNGHPVLYIVMHCNHREANNGLYDAFRMLFSYVESYMPRDGASSAAFAASHRYLRELINGNISSIDEAITRAAYATIPFYQDYLLYQITFDDNFNTPLARLAVSLNERLPFSYVLTHNHNILVISSCRDNRDHSETVLSLISQIISNFPHSIGISNRFHNLWELSTALEQSGCALEYGAHIRKAYLNKGQTLPKEFTFEDCLLTLLVAKSYNSSPEIFKNSFMFQSVRTIIDYDKQHHTNLLETLKTYLMLHQKATDTGKRLHLHRNTVLYHIERIEQMLHVSLTDPQVCIKLQLGIEFYRSQMLDLHM